MKAISLLSASSAFALALLRLGVAQASPTFPQEVRAHLALPCTPQCVICHTTNLGGFGTTNAFGKILETPLANGGGGLRAARDETVGPALDRMSAKMPPDDVDGDGVDDISELKNGDSPAIAGPNGVGLACSAVTYGCSLRSTEGLHTDFVALGAGLLTLLGLAFRLSRARRR